MVVGKQEEGKTYHTGQNVRINFGNSFEPQWNSGKIVDDSPERTCSEKIASWVAVKKPLVVNVDGQEITINQNMSTIRPKVETS